MNKPQLITSLSRKSEITKKEAERHIENLLEIIMDAVASGSPVKVIGFGKFEKKEVKGRTGTIQFGERKGQEWSKEDSWKVVFESGKIFDDKVKGVV